MRGPLGPFSPNDAGRPLIFFIWTSSPPTATTSIWKHALSASWTAKWRTSRSSPDSNETFTLLMASSFLRNGFPEARVSERQLKHLVDEFRRILESGVPH